MRSEQQHSHVASRSRSGVGVGSVRTDCLTIDMRKVGHEVAIAQLTERASEFEHEAHRQVAFFREESRKLGFADPDALLSADPATFMALAATWRDRNPRGLLVQRLLSNEFR